MRVVLIATIFLTQTSIVYGANIITIKLIKNKPFIKLFKTNNMHMGLL